MKALLSVTPGGPECLEIRTVADLIPKAGQVVVRVHACGVNFPDGLFIRDLYQVKLARPFSPGAEVAGIVAAIGPGVSELAIGDRVAGIIGSGGMAELVCGEASRFTKIPESMSFADAAAFIFTYATAHYALHDRGMLASGETVLVLGAAGGIGLASVELAKAAGARVVAAVSSQAKAEVARAHGADEVVIYGRSPFDTDARKSLTEALKAAVGKGGSQVIVDPVGGDYAEPALRTMAWQGRYLVVGFTAGIGRAPMNLILLKGCQMVGVDWRQFLLYEPDGHARIMQRLFQIYAQGQIRPEIQQRFSLERAPEAIRLMESRGAIGKLVIEVIAGETIDSR